MLSAFHSKADVILLQLPLSYHVFSLGAALEHLNFCGPSPYLWWLSLLRLITDFLFCVLHVA